MTDNELRGIIIKLFYDKRRERDPFTPQPEDFDPPIPEVDLFRICAQLRQHGLLEWYPIDTFDSQSGWGKISASGVDVVETKGSSSPIGITFTHTQHISVSNSQAVQIGNGNIQSISFVIENLINKIEQISASDEDKKEAKYRLKAFLEHPLVTTILGGLSLDLIKKLMN